MSPRFLRIFFSTFFTSNNFISNFNGASDDIIGGIRRNNSNSVHSRSCCTLRHSIVSSFIFNAFNTQLCRFWLYAAIYEFHFGFDSDKKKWKSNDSRSWTSRVLESVDQTWHFDANEYSIWSTNRFLFCSHLPICIHIAFLRWLPNIAAIINKE